jgi:pimeloyl-ACP methyl ester carboxylesterase
MAPLRSEQWQSAAAKIVDGMLPATMPSERKEFIRSRMLAQPQRTMVEDFEASIDPAVWSDETIEVPVLVLNARSPSWTPEYVSFVRKLIPGVDYQEMRGVSHFLQMDAPAEFDARLDRFLDSIGR